MSYSKEILKYPTKAIVVEDNFWYYGKQKTKTKINIPAIMSLQEPADTTTVSTKKTNKMIKDTYVQKTLNYVEVYVPDACYTYPTEEEIKNDKQTVFGATKDYIPEGKSKPIDNGINGEKVTGMARVIRKNTRLIVIFIDGEATADNIKVLCKFDDAAEEENLVASYNKLGNTGGISNLTASSAIR